MAELGMDNRQLSSYFEPMADSRATLPALTGLRFCAAVLVVTNHFACGLPLPAPIHAATTSGFVGVNWFFLLSGFVLAYVYLDECGELRGSAATFYVARFARIYPVYALGMLIAIPPAIWWHNPHATLAATAVAGLTLTQAWLPWSAVSWNPPGWSLSVEAVFYALFPILGVAIARVAVTRRVIWGLALWLMMLIPPAFYLAAQPDGVTDGWLNNSAYWMLHLQMNPILHLPEFAAGIALGRLYTARRGVEWFSSDLVCSGLMALSVASLVTDHVLPFVLVHNGVFDPLYAATLYALACNSGKATAALRLTPVVLLGEASYVLYMLHVPLYDWLLRVRPDTSSASVRVFVVYFCCAVGAALLVHAGLERPARRIIREVWSRREGSAPGTCLTGAERSARQHTVDSQPGLVVPREA